MMEADIKRKNTKCKISFVENTFTKTFPDRHEAPILLNNNDGMKHVYCLIL